MKQGKLYQGNQVVQIHINQPLHSPLLYSLYLLNLTRMNEQKKGIQDMDPKEAQNTLLLSNLVSL